MAIISGETYHKFGIDGIDCEDLSQIYGYRKLWEKSFTILSTSGLQDTTWLGIFTDGVVNLDTVDVVSNVDNVRVTLVVRIFPDYGDVTSRSSFASVLATNDGNNGYWNTGTLVNGGITTATISAKRQVGLVKPAIDADELTVRIRGSIEVRKYIFSAGGPS